MADGVAEPGGLHIVRVLVGQIDVADHVVFLPDQGHHFRRLQEIDRRHRIEQPAGNADRPASFLGREDRFAGQHALIDLSQFLPRPGLQNRAAQIGDVEGRLLAGSHGELVVDVGMVGIGRDGSRSARRRRENHRRWVHRFPARRQSSRPCCPCRNSAPRCSRRRRLASASRRLGAPSARRPSSAAFANGSSLTPSAPARACRQSSV